MKVGDYVRTENGLIGKIIGFKGDMVETDNKKLITYKSDHSECKIKERPIDLIETGDYVNGFYVLGVYQEPKYLITDDCSVYEEEIKSIVTKEQFESMEYEVN